MAKKRPAAERCSEYPLADQLDRVGDELQLLRQVLDELRSDLQWAVQNGRIVVQCEVVNSDRSTDTESQGTDSVTSLEENVPEAAPQHDPPVSGTLTL